MKSINGGRGVWFVLLSALGALAMGCGAEAGGEELGESQQALTWGSWAQIPSSPLADQFGVAFASKKHFRFSAYVVPYDATLRQDTWSGINFAGWTTLTGGTSTTNVHSKPTGTSWLGSGGVDASRNLLLAYLHYNDVTGAVDLRFGWSPESEGSGTTFTWTTLTGSNDISLSPPALAYANGYAYVFVKKNDNKIYFKKNNVSAGYNTANWSASWSVVGTSTMGGGVAAAASGSNTITVAASPVSGGSACLINAVTASTGAVSNTGAWSSITGCSQSAFSTPGLAATGSGLNGLARIVVLKSGSPNTLATATGSGTSSTWSSFTTLPSGCTPISDPAITQIKSSGDIAFGTLCSASSTVPSWIQMTP